MLRPGSFFSRSASFAVAGLASLRRASWIWIVPVGEVHLVPLASLACCGTSLVGMPSRTPVPGSVCDLPADTFLLSLGGVGEHAALLRIEHAGWLAAAPLLEFLDGVDHALADVARDRAVILADPGEVRLQRQPLGLPHRIRRFLRLLQRGADRDRRDRLRLGARRGGRRHLRLRGWSRDRKNRRRDHQCC